MNTKLHFSVLTICYLLFSVMLSQYAQASKLNTNSLTVPKALDRAPSFGEAIKHFILVDADTNTEIASISDGKILNSISIKDKNLNIKVNTIGETDFISVEFSLSGPLNRSWTEMKAPYALFGDINGDYNGVPLPAGKYHLSASAIHELGGHLNTIEVSFIVPDSLGIIGLDIIFLEENRIFSAGGLSDGRVFNATNDPFLKNPKTVIALVDEGFTGSIKMEIEGPPLWGSSSRIENIAPYSMFGDRSHLPFEDAHRDYNFQNFTDGIYRIKATPYEKPNGVGTAGTSMSITIIIEDNNQIRFEYQSDTTIHKPFKFIEIEDGQTYFPQSGEFTHETVIVAAITNAPPEGSVIFSIAGPINHTQVENKAPYSLFGDIEGNFNRRSFPEGDYTLTATLYSEPEGKGNAGVPLTTAFKIEIEFGTHIIRLFNADTTNEIEDLHSLFEGNSIDIEETPTNNATILVDYECDEFDICPGSVQLKLNGPINISRIENVSPYTLFGDLGYSELNGDNFPVGEYSIEVTPYSGVNATGEASETVTRKFEIIDSRNTPVLKSILYPNPASSTSFVAPNDNNPNTKTIVFDMAGSKIKEMTSRGSNEKAIDVSELPPGIYIIQIQTEKGVETKKLVVQ